MFKNVASQKWIVFAFNVADNTAVTGDAANITAKLSKDGAAAAATNDVNPTEIEDGYYAFDLTAAETNGDALLLLPESATANVQVIGVPGVIYTDPANYTSLAVNASGHVSRVTLVDTTTANTDMRGTDGANTVAPDNASVSAIKTKTDFLPSVAAGSAGGLFRAGSNAPVTITATNGNALTLQAAGAEGSGLWCKGSGTGHGIRAEGSTGTQSCGIAAKSGTSGNGAGLFCEGEGVNGGFGIMARGRKGLPGIYALALDSGSGFVAEASANHAFRAHYTGAGTFSAVSIEAPSGTGASAGIIVSDGITADIDGIINWNPAWDAEVESEVNDGLVAYGAATSSEVTAIQNNTRVVRVVPTIIERPDSGTSTFRIEMLLYDSVGNMEEPDAAPTLSLVNQAGTDMSSRLDNATGTLVSTGRYRWVYTASDADALEQLLWTFSVVEGGATRAYGNTTLIVDTTAVDFTAADRTKLNEIAADVENIDGAAMRGTDNALLATSAPTNFSDLLITAGGHISRVVLVDTTTVNTDMRGTDGANTVTPPTPADLLDLTDGVEADWTVRKALRILLSAAAAKSSGHSTNAPIYRDVNDTKNRIVATSNADGRTSVTLDGD